MSSGTSEIFLFEDYTLPMQDGASLKPIAPRLQDIRERIRSLIESCAHLSKMAEHIKKELVNTISFGISLAQSTNSVITVQSENENEISISLVFSSFVLMEFPEVLQFQIIAKRADSISISTPNEVTQNTMISFCIELNEAIEADG